MNNFSIKDLMQPDDQKSSSKVMIDFEGELFDVYNLNRVQIIQEYNEKESRKDFVLLLHFSSWPRQKKFTYPSESTLEKSRAEFLRILKLTGKITIIQ